MTGLRKGLLRDWRNNLFLLRIAWKAAPGYTLLFALERVRGQLVIFLEFTIALQFVLDCVEFGRPFRDAALFLGALLAFVVLGLAFGAYMQNKLALKAMPVVKQRLKETLYAQAKAMDLAAYDDPQFYNDYILATQEADQQMDRLYNAIDQAVSSVTQVLLSGVFLLTANPVSILFVFGSLGLRLWMENVINKIGFTLRMAKNPLERKLAYINRVFYLADYAKELRLNPAVVDRMRAEHRAASAQLLTLEKKYAPRLFILNWVNQYVCGHFTIGTLYVLYLAYSAVVLRSLSLGSVAVLSGAAFRLLGTISWLAWFFPTLADISRYVEKIKSFLEKEPAIRNDGHAPLPTGPVTVSVKNVSFRYGDDAPYVLRNVSIDFNAGEKAAIVGYNGAGKTTLIKLLLRLYDPTEGEILLNGVNIKEFDLEAYRQMAGVIFQDYKIFAASLMENVCMDVPGNTKMGVTGALRKAGFAERLATLSEGLDTPLTTEFMETGVNLSGGESQKVAIARAFYKDAPLIVLDEPSSAMDPISEYHFNHAVTDTAKDKTVVFISHRLSTTRVSDKIYLLENGAVAESGTHGGLLGQAGRYAEMWQAQTERYLGRV